MLTTALGSWTTHLLTYDGKGQVIREVAQAYFTLPLPDQKDQVLPLRVALIRDLRRQIPGAPPEEDPNEEPGLPPWWWENWQAEPGVSGADHGQAHPHCDNSTAH